ncbi:MAG: hypothetical protein A2918_02755 [Candidatus Yanofskybacteria bacterium RIFCSPLOWO2_01_FULL_42_49]|uniref:Excinuclease ABC subunit C n=1 Tax=Candidatus Yanofskybacteria bacterium RIFCSPLOWO2_01_FULL_42_49 TaxID=1802694 RepID=A0A1F8GCC7_9BACT|nr:MAG: hypothetical protein A2918_02755 [Candidatus Yanofskybacteria bacterium RIFCSPLOWO2_01_FULL_42_49]
MFQPMTTEQLKLVWKNLPEKTGIYLFQGANNKPLYIGKALNLKTRVSQYVKTGDLRLQKMVSLAKDIKVIETGSDIGALILESQLIKKHKPAFNIMLRDDKQYFYVIFTKEKFPKIFLSHQPSAISHKPLTSIGPFTDGTALKTTLRYLRRVFPYCTCKKPHNNFCLNYHIGKCAGICCLKQQSRIYNFSRWQSHRGSSTKSGQLFRQRRIRLWRTISKEKEYGRNVKAVKDILNGEKTSLLKKLEKEMVALGKKEEFDKAIETRNKIDKIKRVFENASIIQNIPYYDISNNHNERALLELKKFLKLKQLPHHIEGYDVANIQGKYAVGAMVLFTDGKPDKSGYRRFKILNPKSETLNKFQILNSKFKTGGDVGMLKEILTRRFRHPEWSLPDLIVIDGGKAQLNTALAVLRELRIMNNELRITALTKDERHRGSKIFIAGKKNAIPLSRLPISVKNLLLQVNAEAHRFAIGYYRQLHRRSIETRNF